MNTAPDSAGKSSKGFLLVVEDQTAQNFDEQQPIPSRFTTQHGKHGWRELILNVMQRDEG